VSPSRSRKHEDKVMKRHGGRRNPASGALPGWKGDGQTEPHLYELKYTDKASYKLKLAELRKIGQEALIHKKSPVFLVTFCEGNREFSYVIIPEEDFLEMRDGDGGTT